MEPFGDNSIRYQADEVTSLNDLGSKVKSFIVDEQAFLQKHYPGVEVTAEISRRGPCNEKLIELDLEHSHLRFSVNKINIAKYFDGRNYAYSVVFALHNGIKDASTKTRDAYMRYCE